MFLKLLFLIFFVLLNYLQAEEFEKVYNISMAKFDKMLGDILREMKIKLKNVCYDEENESCLLVCEYNNNLINLKYSSYNENKTKFYINVKSAFSDMRDLLIKKIEEKIGKEEANIFKEDITENHKEKKEQVIKKKVENDYVSLASFGISLGKGFGLIGVFLNFRLSDLAGIEIGCGLRPVIVLLKDFWTEQETKKSTITYMPGIKFQYYFTKMKTQKQHGIETHFGYSPDYGINIGVAYTYDYYFNQNLGIGINLGIIIFPYLPVNLRQFLSKNFNAWSAEYPTYAALLWGIYLKFNISGDN